MIFILPFHSSVIDVLVLSLMIPMYAKEKVSEEKEKCFRIIAKAKKIAWVIRLGKEKV